MRWLSNLAILISLCLPIRGASPPAATTVRLLLPVESIRPGESFVAGVQLTSQAGWHTYWQFGGDAGAPTTLDWKLPAGFRAGPIQWPAPERFDDSGIITYVYHGTTILLVPFTVDPGTATGPHELTAKVDWLECKESCLPRKGQIRATLNVGPATKPSPSADTLRNAQGGIPPSLPPGTATASWDGPAQGNERTLLIHWTPPAGPGVPDFFGIAGDNFDISTTTTRLSPTPPAVVLRKKVKRTEGDWPKKIEGLLVRIETGKPPSTAFHASLSVPGDSAAGADLSPPVPSIPADSTKESGVAPAPAARTPVPTPFTLWRALLFGVLGGLILNIMPCVLPVIALKILGFVRQSRSDPAETRKLGLIYALGVWFSFLVLAGMVVTVKKAAGIASWGMQFGNPVFLVILTTLVLLVALSLFGVYEINLGGGAMDAAGELASKEGAAGAFFNGMLAVALATPCTAPFLAPALGYAFTASTPTIVLVFTAVAAGLAAPYVVLSWKPNWLRFLPKPGQWMVRFKVAMGFPMLATALWLYTLAADHFGEGGPLWLGIFLVGIALSAWVWGEFAQRGSRHQTAAVVVAIALAGIAYGGTLENELRWRSPQSAPSRITPNQPQDADGIPWQPWSRNAVELARKSGRPVFVDFTANWCLTCKVNERSSIEIPEVRARLKAIQAIAFKGDHTRLPPAITEELQRHGRAGVPLVLVYPKDSSKDPEVLPEVLTPGIVLEALDKAAR